jgi:cytosine deaminase
MTDWASVLRAYEPDPKLKDDSVALRACQLAAEGARLGTYGVGALLMDDHLNVIVEGHNEVYVAGFRSDLHAEMVVLNRFEEGGKGLEDRHRYTLITSLEPCPMCMTRLIFAGIGTILYVFPDEIGGMVQRQASLPPIFRTLTERQGQRWRQAECSELLRQAAFEIWDRSRPGLDPENRLKGPTGGGNP